MTKDALWSVRLHQMKGTGGGDDDKIPFFINYKDNNNNDSSSSSSSSPSALLFVFNHAISNQTSTNLMLDHLLDELEGVCSKETSVTSVFLPPSNRVCWERITC